MLGQQFRAEEHCESQKLAQVVPRGPGIESDSGVKSLVSLLVRTARALEAYTLEFRLVRVLK